MTTSGVTRVPPTTAVLKNRGIPVKLHRLVTDEYGQVVRPTQRLYDAEDVPVIEEVWLQLTAAVIADIEETWGDLDGWQKALSTQAYKALTTTVALAFEWFTTGPDGLPVADSRRAGKAMIDGEIAGYSTAIGCAFMLAQGFPPEKVGEALRAGVVEVKKAMAELEKVDMAALMSPDRSDDDGDTPTNPPASIPGPVGTPPGSDSSSTPTSSGA